MTTDRHRVGRRWDVVMAMAAMVMDMNVMAISMLLEILDGI